MNELWKVGERLRRLHDQLESRDRSGFDVSDDIGELAEGLDPIGHHSNSYPFLAVARLLEADYGDVLWFADYLTTYSSTPRDDPRFTGALERLSHEARSVIASRVSALQRGVAR